MQKGFTTFVEHAPGRPVPNERLPHFFDAITERTHIVSRAIADRSQTVADLAIACIEKFLEQTGTGAGDCDALVFASCSHGGKLERLAHEAASRFAVGNVLTCDYACSGFPRAVQLAQERCEDCEGHVLIVTSEILSRLIDWSREETAILFGDRAAVTSIHPEGRHRILHAQAHEIDDQECLLSLSRRENALAFDGTTGERSVIAMQGKKLYRRAPSEMLSLSLQALDSLGIPRENLTHMIPHQANGKFAEKLASLVAKEGLDSVTIVNEIAGMANTASASIPCAMARVQDRLFEGAVTACPAIGAGPAFAAGKLTQGVVVFETGPQ